MAGTPQATIEEAARAYVDGDEGRLAAQLADDVYVRGSHRRDRWDDADSTRAGLRDELQRHRAGQIGGSLVNFADNPVDIKGDGDVVWSSRTGTLSIDGVEIESATWTTVLQKDKEKEGWKIVHSHFSIHL